MNTPALCLHLPLNLADPLVCLQIKFVLDTTHIHNLASAIQQIQLIEATPVLEL